MTQLELQCNNDFIYLIIPLFGVYFLKNMMFCLKVCVRVKLCSEISVERKNKFLMTSGYFDCYFWIKWYQLLKWTSSVIWFQKICACLRLLNEAQLKLHTINVKIVVFSWFQPILTWETNPFEPHVYLSFNGF